MLVWFGALAVVGVAGIRADRHRATTAADLAALSGAQQVATAPEGPCAVARAVAEENDARLADCAVTELTVHLEVRVHARTWPGEVSARARAGPGLRT